MNKKNEIIESIKKFDDKYFNQDQKNIAINIIENAPDQEVQQYADFIFTKFGLGFKFDYSPEIAKGRIITLFEDKKKRINVKDEILDDENKLIIGDNYNALKSLLLTHKQKIDVIYIDPPYNTESAKNDGNSSFKEGYANNFIYKNKFGRNGWLTMIKDRLVLARDLLSDNGVIFVSIDDNEQAYLKVLMDSIFGEENSLPSLKWRKSENIKMDSRYFSNNVEYIHVYAKQKDQLVPFKKRKSPKGRFNLTDKNGSYYLAKLDANALTYTKSLDYIIKDLDGNEYCAGGDFEKRKDRLNGNHNVKDICWRWSQEKFLDGLKNNEIVFKNNNVYNKIYWKDEENKPWIDYIDFTSNQTGQKELNSIFNDRVFDHPKPTYLLSWLINLIDNKNLIVLDFFAGSGTLGHAILELNRNDKGNRKFILVTNNENNIADKITFERLHRIILGKGTKNELNFDWIKNHKNYNDSKLRVIRIDDSNIISLDSKNPEKIISDAKDGLKLLDGKYNKKDLNLYYDLSALNPLED